MTTYLLLPSRGFTKAVLFSSIDDAAKIAAHLWTKSTLSYDGPGFPDFRPDVYFTKRPGPISDKERQEFQVSMVKYYHGGFPDMSKELRKKAKEAEDALRLSLESVRKSKAEQREAVPDKS